MSPYDNPIFPCLNTPPKIAVPLFILMITLFLIFSHKKEKPIQSIQTNIEIEETGTINEIDTSKWDVNQPLYLGEKPGNLTTNKPSNHFGDFVTIYISSLN